MRVPHRHRHRLMPHERLHCGQIDASHHQAGGEGVAWVPLWVRNTAVEGSALPFSSRNVSVNVAVIGILRVSRFLTYEHLRCFLNAHELLTHSHLSSSWETMVNRGTLIF